MPVKQTWRMKVNEFIKNCNLSNKKTKQTKRNPVHILWICGVPCVYVVNVICCLCFFRPPKYYHCFIKRAFFIRYVCHEYLKYSNFVSLIALTIRSIFCDLMIIHQIVAYHAALTSSIPCQYCMPTLYCPLVGSENYLMYDSVLTK